MNTNMNVTIRRLTNAFIILFLLISGVAAYIQIGNQAFFNGPVLANSSLDPPKCPPVDVPIRGRILDRNGNVIAQSVPDPQSFCGYRRQYASWVVSSGLAPLIGYYSYQYGAGGIEAEYNDQLAGINAGESIQNTVGKLLHTPQMGQDIYLTIDKNIQLTAAQHYDSSALHGGACETQDNPPGSIIVEDPNSGEILAMVSYPAYDPNKIVQTDSLDPATRSAGQQYFRQVNTASTPSLINRAAQGLYDPGSSFKTVTLTAALDTGQVGLTDATFTRDQAMDYVVNGQHIHWDDYSSFAAVAQFPMDLEHAYAYSDNVIYARMGVTLGTDTWLKYVAKFGIATPGRDWQPVPFDAPHAQSSAYPGPSGGKPFDFTVNDLAASAFGQGDLLISPLTMAEVASTMAANGVLWEPHVVWKQVPASNGTPGDSKQTLPAQTTPFTGQPIIQPGTAQNIRLAMWSVVQYGTGSYGLPPHNGYLASNSGTFEGGKTGTAQLGSGQPDSWWISLAPDDQASGAAGKGAQYVVVVNKEGSGEGACQVYVADDIYRSLFHL
jgi:cell division protein FtsI/penicillin-binding protein 2